MNKNIIMVAILIVLVLVSSVQAFQLISLKSKIDTSSLKLGAGAGKSPQITAQSSGTSGGVAELPSMVGGC